jgi:BioD-like phosphotransacetylase family protein
MNKILVMSVMPKAGKTTVALGIALKAGGTIGYMKPLGDNQVYKKKRLVDYDAALFKQTFDIDNPVEDLTVGFHHSKIIHSFPNINQELKARFEALSNNKDFFIVEGSTDLIHGQFLGLDSLSLASNLDVGVILVLSGDLYDMMDSLTLIKSFVLRKNVEFVGVVIDKVKDEHIDKLISILETEHIAFLGFMPYLPILDLMCVRYVADKLFARVIAGSGGLEKPVENVLIAALSANQMIRHPDFKTEHKLIITGGDRTDVVAASLKDSNTSCIVLTNDIIPPSNILARADKYNIPLLSIRSDTFTAAKKVEDIESIILPAETPKIEAIRHAADRIDIKSIINF